MSFQQTETLDDPDFDLEETPGVVPGAPYNFAAKRNINQQAAFLQDSITLGPWNISAGIRFDEYRGIINRHGWQPRAGISYTVKPTSTVLRLAYSRTFETPYNENLLLSSSNFAGANNIAIEPGRRNQFNAGFQQAISKWFVVDADYFWKFTDNAFDFATLLKSYRVHSVRGDRWGGEFPRERLRALGIGYEIAEKPKADIYRECLPLLNSERVELLDLPRLKAQLIGLERRTARGGRDSIDHAPGGHDDIANVVAGALLMALDSQGWPMKITPELLASSARPGPFSRIHRRQL